MYDPEGVYTYLWSVPIGFNTTGKLILWLGDIDTMDKTSQLLLKAYNVPSDHLLVNSEFYQAQMNCNFSKPSIEMQIVLEKERFVKNIKNKYGINLDHLTEQNKELEKQMQRPVAYTKPAMFHIINAFHRHLIEGIDTHGLKVLYETLYNESERDKKYKSYLQIKLIDKILAKLVPNTYSDSDLRALVAPLYVLNDYRIILDHSIGDEEEKRNNILQSLGIDCFEKQEEIYLAEINGLRKLYQMLAILTNQ